LVAHTKGIIVLRKALHPKREREREVIGGWWRLHIEELQ
jgi:hypothetical protein